MPEDRLLYVHALAPPTPGGTPVIVRRVLAGLGPQIEVDTLTDLTLRRRVGRGPVIPGRYFYFLKLPPLLDRWAPGALAIWLANLALAVLAGVRGAGLARRRGADWVLSVADHGFSLIAGDVAARLAGVPHVIWVFDLWEENAYGPLDRWTAGRLERGLWRRAAAILGHDDEIAEHYRRKHGVAVSVLPTPIEVDGAADGARPPSGPHEVLFAGSLYWAQDEALRRLAAVCRELDDVTLTVVGSEQLARERGIEADAFEPPLSPEEFRARVSRASVVFVGLSFDSPHPEVIATASPARLPEYMASGTPLLVHAPAGSHVAEYARREDFAEVVDRPDPQALAAGLRRTIDDEALSNMRARRARALALERHDAARVRERMRTILAGLRRPPVRRQIPLTERATPLLQTIASTALGRLQAERAVRRPGQVVRAHPAALRSLLRTLSADCHSVIDVGTGLMSSLELLACPVKIGVDVHRPYLEHRRVPEAVPVNASATELEKLFVPGAVDLVTLIDVLEHFTPEDAREVLRQAESVARRRVVLFTPRGEFPQDGFDAFGLGGEEYQRHRSSWQPDDLVALGYRVVVLPGLHNRDNASFVEAFGPDAPPVDALLAYKETA